MVQEREKKMREQETGLKKSIFLENVHQPICLYLLSDLWQF